MNGLLLDTHIFLWRAVDDSRLPEKIHDLIDEESGPVYLSTVSAWEIAIKHGLGKLDLRRPITDLLNLRTYGMQFLQPSSQEFVAYSQLGFPVEGHRDPFDRMLAVQALERDLLFVTADVVFQRYLPSNLQLVR